MALGLLDLSIVTRQLTDQLTAFKYAFAPWLQDQFGVSFTGLAPDVARLDTSAGCQVSVYLFHVAADKFHRNTFPLGGPAQRIPEQPMALTLYYLVTAYEANSYDHEQRAMSIVLKCFHDTPILSLEEAEEEFTLSIEPQTVDEIGRLWQSISSPMRLSAVYRVSVIFIGAPEPKVPEAVRHAPDFQPPHNVEPFPSAPGAVGGAATADRTGLVLIAAGNPAFAAGTTTVRLRALKLAEIAGLTDPLLARHFRVQDPQTLQVRVPLFTPAGRYLLTVQSAPGVPALEIALAVPQATVSIGAVSGSAAIFIDDAGFAAGTTKLRLDGVPLAEIVAGQPGAGEFRVAGPETLLLRAPPATTPGRHLLAVQPATGRRLPDLWLEVS